MSGDRAAPTRSAALDGFIVGVANPKSVVFFAALLPQFADRPQRLERLGIAGGASMIGLGVLLATTGRSE